MKGVQYFKAAMCVALATPTLCLALDCSSSLTPASQIETVGDYLTPKKDFEKKKIGHLYSVELWRSGDCYFGVFSLTDSQEGDPPFGLLEDVIYDPKTKALSFKSKITPGVIPAGGDRTEDVPARAVIEFSGTFDQKTIAGTMINSDKTYTDTRYKWPDPPQPPQSEKVVLKFDKLYSDAIRSQATYEGWIEQKKAVLGGANGPKW